MEVVPPTINEIFEGYKVHNYADLQLVHHPDIEFLRTDNDTDFRDKWWATYETLGGKVTENDFDDIMAMYYILIKDAFSKSRSSLNRWDEVQAKLIKVFGFSEAYLIYKAWEAMMDGSDY